MTTSEPIVIVGAGAAGLMAARVLARAGVGVTVLEARDRCGGRIETLPREIFGYAAEAGAEFIHGEAPVTRALVREAGLALAPTAGARWWVRDGKFSQDELIGSHAPELYQALAALTDDLPVAEFLARHFSEPRFDNLRRGVTRMVEGYDAADPMRFSTLALREEWMGRGSGSQDRIVEGYGALIDHLAADCRHHGVAIELGAIVTAIALVDGRAVARCADGRSHAGARVILTVPLPVLADIALPEPARRTAAQARDTIGFGNVIKFLLGFATPWWTHAGGRDLSDLSFLLAATPVPTWWTQHPRDHAVLTGWFAGPRSTTVPQLDEAALVALGVASLAEIFGLPAARLRDDLTSARAFNWANDPFARGAYSYATPTSRAAQTQLARIDGPICFSGEALYHGRDMGTVEAALATGAETARALLAG